MTDHGAAAWGHRGTLVGELAARTNLRGDVEVAHLPLNQGFRPRLAVPVQLSSTEFYSTLHP